MRMSSGSSRVVSRRTHSQAALRSAIEACEPRRLMAVTTVTGTVFRDYDQDGVRDAGDKGLANYAVYADLNGNTKLDAGEASTMTDANGFYSLGVPLQDGSRTIGLRLSNVPMGSITVPTAKAYFGTFDTAQTLADRNYGLVTTTTLIGGYVYDDNNGDGLRGPGDTGRANEFVYVDLNQDGVFNGVDASTRTDATGRYTIQGLPDGGGTSTVRVRDVPAASLTPVFYTIALNGNVGGQQLNLNFNVKVANPKPVGLVSFLPAADVNGNNTIDAGETSISGGIAWIDVNKNALFDSGEVRLIENPELQKAYLANVAPGTYTIAFRRPGDTDSYSDYSVPVTVTNGGFSNVQRAVSPVQQYSTITGTVFRDSDKDGVRDAGELGLANYTVYADLNYNSVKDGNDVSATTDANGFYTLAVPLQPGTRSVAVQLLNVPYSQVTAPPGGAHTGKFNVVLTAGNRNFGIAPTAQATTTISGVIFNDANLNGVRDSGEAGIGYTTDISSVYVDLNRNGTFDAGDLTSGPINLAGKDGSTYTIAGVPVGQAVDIRYVGGDGSVIVADGELLQTTPLQIGYDKPLTVMTTAATVTANLGFARTVTLQGNALYDVNGNGKSDAGEPAVYGGALSGYWLDLDNDHVRDAGEVRVPQVARYRHTFGPFDTSLSVPYGTYTIAYAPDASIGAVAVAYATVTTTPGNGTSGIATLAVPVTRPAVSGLAFDDNNGNGAYDAADSPIIGFVYADYDNNGAFDKDDDGVQIAYNTTKLDATYYLPVDAGRSFTLRVVGDLDRDPLRTTQSYAIGGLTGTQQAFGKNFANPPAVVAKFSTITGTVFRDSDKDGVRDAGEVGLANQTIFADLNYNGINDAGDVAATTNASGFYTLAVPLQDGKRSLAVQLQNVSTALITAPPGGMHTGKFNVELTAGNRNFGVVPTTSVYGYAYVDANKNGQRDAGEGAPDGTIVYADLNGNGVYDNYEPSDFVFANGVNDYRYDIDGVAAGVPTKIRAILYGSGYAPSNYLFAGADPFFGPTNTVTPAGALTYAGDFATIAAGGRVLTESFFDFDGDGLRTSPEPRREIMIDSAKQAPTIWLDLNGNSVQDANEPALRDFDTANGAPTVDDSYGIRAPAGTYRLAVRYVGDTDKYADLTRTITITEGGLASLPLPSTPIDGAVSGTVFVDANKNGKRDAGESPAEGQLVFADLNGNGVREFDVEPSAFTDANGRYAVGGIPLSSTPRSIVLGFGPISPFVTTTPAGGKYLEVFSAARIASGRDFGISN